MFDLFPFLRLDRGTPEEKIETIANYLMEFKEILEFQLANIDTDNLSPGLVEKLNTLGANVSSNKEEKESELGQLANKGSSIYDVVNSDLFKEAVNNQIPKALTFNVNFETGHLEYAVNE